MARVLVVGSNFAGFTGALEVRRKLRDLGEKEGHEVTVIGMAEDFLFTPSLLWVPFAEREIKDITVPVAPVLEHHGIEFVHDEATLINPVESFVETKSGGRFPFDYLIIATGFKLDWKIEGLGPKAETSCVCTPPDALATREDFQKLVDNPGPAIVGATQGAGCIGAAYEFLFNLEYHLRRYGVRDKVELTWVSPEPFLGHFGIGGMPGGKKLLEEFMTHLKIHWVLNASVDKAFDGTLALENGQKFDYAFAMLVPPFVGQNVITNSSDVGDDKGLIPVRDSYQHVKYPHIFSAGAAINVPSPFTTPVAFGVPKTGFPADVEAKIAGENIARLIHRKANLKERSFGQIPGLCIMDAGHKEVIIIANHLFPPRGVGVLIPNPLYDEGKRLFEKYYLWKIRGGHSRLP